MDITIKSAKGVATLFAPAWDMVMGHKDGSYSDAQYTERYRAILGTINKTTWQWLHDQAEDGEVVLVCYCPDSNFCHTHLLIDYACEHQSALFERNS